MNIRKEFAILKASIRTELMDRMENATAFSLASVGIFLSVVVSIIFFQSLYLHTKNLGGWTLPQVYTLLGTYFFIESIAWATYIRGFNRLPRFIEYGYLDLFIVKPVNLKSFFIYRYIDVVFSVPQCIVGIVLIVYGALHGGSFFNLPIYLILLVCAFIIHFSLVLIFSTINFFILIPQTTYLYGEIFKLGRYPITIYKGFIKLLFTIFIPLAFIYSIPAQAFFGEISTLQLFSACIVASIFYILSDLFWRYGMKHYDSASG